jgi:hypothetical protein
VCTDGPSARDRNADRRALRCRTLTEYADPDLETIAPLPPVEVPPHPDPIGEPPGRSRNQWTVLIVGVVVAALATGFGVTTVLLNLTDSGTSSVSVGPRTTVPSGGGATPGSPAPGSTTPGSTTPADPNEGVLAGLIVNQGDVPATYTVHHPADGINLAAPTLDLCNGTFASDALRTARRQVYVGPTASPSSTSFSTEAVLYGAPADGAQAMGELQSVVERCPPTAVTSPVGEATVITKFSAPPDPSWPRLPTVQRQAYAFVTTDPQSGQSVPGIAVYLRRGRALMGIYFAKPGGAQIPIDGHTTIEQIVALFEARMARLPQTVVNG